MESIALEVEGCQFGVGNLDAFLVGVGVEFTADGLGCGALISGSCLTSWVRLSLCQLDYAAVLQLATKASGAVVDDGLTRPLTDERHVSGTR